MERVRRPSGSPTAPFASLTASSQSPAGAAAAQATNIASTPGAGAQGGPHFAASSETVGLEIDSVGAAALRPPNLPKLWAKAAKHHQMCTTQAPKRRAKRPACAPEKQPPDRRTIGRVHRGHIAVRQAIPGPLRPLYSTLLAAFSSLTSACCQGPALRNQYHCKGVEENGVS